MALAHWAQPGQIQPMPHDIHRPVSTAAPRIEVTNRLVLSIALPMMLAYLTTPLLGLVDTAVIGQFGDAAMLGGLAAGARLNGDGIDETIFLAPLDEVLAKKATLAEDMLALYHGRWNGSVEPVFAEYQY